MTTVTLCATPYNLEADSFFFTSIDDYEEKSAAHFDRHGILVEEYEIQLIDCDDAQLFSACGINQANLNVWFDDIESSLDEHEKVCLFYLVSNGYDLKTALEKLDEPCITQCDLKDAAIELFDEYYLSSIPEHIQIYIDYDRFANDCQCSGDMCQFEYSGTTYTCTNASGI